MDQLTTRRCRRATASKIHSCVWQRVRVQHKLLQQKSSSPLCKSSAVPFPSSNSSGTSTCNKSPHLTTPTTSSLSLETNQTSTAWLLQCPSAFSKSFRLFRQFFDSMLLGRSSVCFVEEIWRTAV